MAEFIVYACPIGPLADSVEEYWRRVDVSIGRNRAHEYAPHVTLTGFFHDEPSSVDGHLAALTQLVEVAPPPAGAVSVTGVLFERDHHLLTVESAWCRTVACSFRDLRSPTATRAEVIRPKALLHLSLAYGFPAHQAAALEQLGRDMVDPASHATWELRFYERLAPGAWCVHASWPLQPLDGSG
jgi:ubiquitin-associated SH3 domain-containing protein